MAVEWGYVYIAPFTRIYFVHNHLALYTSSFFYHIRTEFDSKFFSTHASIYVDVKIIKKSILKKMLVSPFYLTTLEMFFVLARTYMYRQKNGTKNISLLLDWGHEIIWPNDSHPSTWFSYDCYTTSLIKVCASYIRLCICFLSNAAR